MVSPSLLSYHYIHKALPKCPTSSPFERPNCVPGFSILGEPTPPSTINSLDQKNIDDMYETQQTPSTSGDSGYGTTRKKQSERAQDIFDALFSPPSSPPSLKTHPKSSVSRTEPPTTKLSSMFHSKKDLVKFQTWSNNNKARPIPTASTSTGTPIKSKRTRRKTDVELVPDSIITKHTRCKSIGSKSDSTSILSPTDTQLELKNEDGKVTARYVRKTKHTYLRTILTYCILFRN